MPEQGRIKYVAYKRRLAAAADTRDYCKDTKREPDINVLQIMFHGTLDCNGICPSVLRTDISFAEPAEILQGKGFMHSLFGHPVSCLSAEDHLSPFDTCLRPDIHKHVCCPHYLFVMFHDNHSIADVSQTFEDIYQAGRVTRVQSYARLVENIQRPDKRASEGCHEIYPLALTSGQGIGCPVKGQV